MKWLLFIGNYVDEIIYETEEDNTKRQGCCSSLLATHIDIGPIVHF